MPFDNTVDKACQSFRLLDLPPELWSRICKFAVIRPEPTEVLWAFGSNNCHTSSMDYPWHAQPPLARVCRSIRNECLPYFYRANIFYVTTRVRESSKQIKRIIGWARRIGDTNRSMLGSIYLCRQVGYARLIPDTVEDLGIVELDWEAANVREEADFEEIQRKEGKDADNIMVIRWQKSAGEGAGGEDGDRKKFKEHDGQ